jgi:schlafen family protein
MPRDLMTVPIEAIAFEDISNLIGAEEGPRLEFKQALATSDGRPDRWTVDQSRIGASARDDIAKEIVAFANAYGGILIVGVEETDDNPKRAKSIASQQIPRVVDCAEQLERALRSIIDPPLPMMEVRGVVSGGGTGALLIRVGSSPSAPHGFGRPSMAYVRRGSSSEPMTMRDLQSIFFEGRTRLDRVRARREEVRSDYEKIKIAWNAGKLKRPYDREPFPLPDHGIYFRCSAVPLDDFAIGNFPDKFLAVPNQLVPNPRILQHGDLVDFPANIHDWRRRYRSVQHVASAGDRRFWKAVIEADGSLSLVSIMNFTENSGLYMHVYAASILQAMVMSEWMRRWVGRPDIEYVVDADFACRGPMRLRLLEGGFDATAEIPWSGARVGPYSIGRRDGFLRTFDGIERDLWDLCGTRRQEALALKMNVDDVFKSTGL